MMTILFWGPLGKKGKMSIGGGESGNRRTIDMLTSRGINVIEIPKPYPPNIEVIKVPLYALLLIISIIKFSYHCCRAAPPIDIAHVSAFYSHLVYFEVLMMFVAKIRRIPFVYEIRGADMLKVYHKRTWMYRLVFDYVLKHADAIFSQGQEYIDFIKQKAPKEPVYYPNYVSSEHLDPVTDPHREHAEEVWLVYFGRLDEDKRLDVTFRACQKLSSVGFNYRLYVIGTGLPAFEKKLETLCNELGVHHRVTFQPPVSFAELRKRLLQMHFFVFPTRREGHSNSLTEAMAFGVVPICSDAGFNASVVGPCGKILPVDADGSLYALAIQDVWENGKWSELSEQCYRRILSLLSSDVIIPRIITKYNELSESYDPL